jgi:type II secretory pathway pseudopilin PulG
VRSRRPLLGFTAVEVTVATGIVGALLVAGGFVLRSAGDLAQSASDEGAASHRVNAALLPVADAIRRGSFSTFRSLDDTPFSDGETDAGIRLRRVVDYSGGPVLGEPAILRWTRPAGSPVGDVTVEEGGVTMVLARNVTAFRVARTGEAFVVTASARSGPEDSRGRAESGRIVVRARNP